MPAHVAFNVEPSNNNAIADGIDFLHFHTIAHKLARGASSFFLPMVIFSQFQMHAECARCVIPAPPIFTTTTYLPRVSWDYLATCPFVPSPHLLITANQSRHLIIRRALSVPSIREYFHNNKRNLCLIHRGIPFLACLAGLAYRTHGRAKFSSMRKCCSFSALRRAFVAAFSRDKSS